MSEAESAEPEWWVGQEFSSYKEFEERLTAYQKNAFCLFTTARSEKSGDQGDDLVYTSLTLRCKQYGSKKENPKLSGERPKQKTYKIGCEATIKLSRRLKKRKLFIAYLNLEHNHPCNATTFLGYPEVRRMSADAVEDVIKYQRAHAIPSIIRPLIKKSETDCSKIILGRDISNVRTKTKKEERRGRSEEEMLQDKLNEIQAADPGAYARITTDEHKNVLFVFIQTSDMRDVLNKFPEVLLMDLTYKVNRNQMPTFVMEAVDGEGLGQPVGYAFVANECKETLSGVLEEFVKSSGQDTIEKIKVVVIDKDPSEIYAVTQILPNAEIHICAVHTEGNFKKYMKGEPNKKEAFEAMKGMIYSCNQDEFNSNYEKFEHSASIDLKKKFDDNWLKKKEVWSLKDKAVILSLRNFTTNRVESHNHILKYYLDSDTPLYEAVSNLASIVLANRKDDRLYRMHEILTKKVYINRCSNPVINEICNELTGYASKIVCEQHALMKNLETVEKMLM